MGRLLKKKPSIKKKKKKPNGETGESKAVSGLIGTDQAAKSPGPSREIKKKPVSLQPKSTVRTWIGSGNDKNFLNKSIQFLREVKIELKKVTWPSRKQTIGSTVVVVILVLIVSLFLGVVDIGLSSLVRVVLQ
jgi:preprotein translocase subunit SecE